MEIPAAEREMLATLGIVAILCTLVHVSELPIIVESKETGIGVSEVSVTKSHVYERVVAVVIIILSRANDGPTREIILCVIGGITWAFVFHIVKGTILFGCTPSEMPANRDIAAPPGTSIQSRTVVDHSSQPPAGTEPSVAELVVAAFLQCCDNVFNREFRLELLGDQIRVGVSIATPVRGGLGMASAFLFVKPAVTLYRII
jgi:hypothetical protein